MAVTRILGYSAHLTTSVVGKNVLTLLGPVCLPKDHQHPCEQVRHGFCPGLVYY